jgi:hypothetical protein
MLKWKALDLSIGNMGEVALLVKMGFQKGMRGQKMGGIRIGQGATGSTATMGLLCRKIRFF